MANKWEYCMLMQKESAGTRIGFGRGALTFRRFGPKGDKANQKLGSADDEQQLGNVLAQLGEAGWELVSVTTTLQPGVCLLGCPLGVQASAGIRGSNGHGLNASKSVEGP